LPPANVGTNPKELHTPTSFAKKSKGYRKRKLNLERGLLRE
jgi:hypothetical protein